MCWLSHLIMEKNESHSEIVSNIKPFINKYKWKRTSYPSKRSDCKML